MFPISLLLPESSQHPTAQAKVQRQDGDDTKMGAIQRNIQRQGVQGEGEKLGGEEDLWHGNILPVPQ